MSDYDNWLLEGSEPAEHDEDSAPHGLCEFCEQPMSYCKSAGEFCPVCGPVPHEALDIESSFHIETPTRKGDLGVVTEIGP